jgi:hypothetical protein
VRGARGKAGGALGRCSLLPLAPLQVFDVVHQTIID